MSTPEPREFPARPVQSPPSVALRELVDRSAAHGLVLVEQRHGIGEALSVEALAAYGVAERLPAPPGGQGGEPQ